VCCVVFLFVVFKLASLFVVVLCGICVYL
jgi:hypothetical protein